MPETIAEKFDEFLSHLNLRDREDNVRMCPSLKRGEIHFQNLVPNFSKKIGEQWYPTFLKV